MRGKWATGILAGISIGFMVVAAVILRKQLVECIIGFSLIFVAGLVCWQLAGKTLTAYTEKLQAIRFSAACALISTAAGVYLCFKIPAMEREGSAAIILAMAASLLAPMIGFLNISRRIDIILMGSTETERKRIESEF